MRRRVEGAQAAGNGGRTNSGSEAGPAGWRAVRMPGSARAWAADLQAVKVQRATRVRWAGGCCGWLLAQGLSSKIACVLGAHRLAGVVWVRTRAGWLDGSRRDKGGHEVRCGK